MDQIVYTGRLFQVIKRTVRKHFEVSGKQIKKEIQYELVRRPPGVRALIVQDDKILLNREYRYEIEDWDYRLPGGKVFDSTEEYVAALKTDNLQAAIEKQLKVEVLEEADIQIISFDLMEISHCGFTVEWDLYYYLVDAFEILPKFYENNIEKSEYEYIENCWMEYPKVYDLCLNGKMVEKSSAFIVLKYLLKNYSKELLKKHD